MVTNVDAKNAKKFVCEKCDFECFKLSNYNKHIMTAKHKMVTNGDKKMPIDNTKHICSCGKEFKYRQGLSRHKKNCNGVQTDIVSTTTTPVSNTNNDLINVIVKQQQETTELKKLLIEQQDTHFKQMKEQQQQIQEQQEQHNKQHEQHNKQIQDLIPQLQQVTNITNNTTNNKFNLNFFLNEQCKDAISIQHFI